MNGHAAMVRPLAGILTAMYGVLAVLEVAALVLFPTQTPGYFAPLAALHGATAGAWWWWAASHGGLR